MVGRTRSSSRALAVALAMGLLLAVLGGPVPAAGQGGWSAPLDAPVEDPFRPPSEHWAAGNRGLAYGAADGQPVTAVDDGTVAFAGLVAGDLHVTVDHGGGLLSTYAYLASVDVVRGQRVTRGQRLAAATTRFHLTARVEGRYVDPARLMAGGTDSPRLLPVDERLRGAGGAGGPEGGSSTLRRATRVLGDVGRWLGGAGSEAVGVAVEAGVGLATAATPGGGPAARLASAATAVAGSATGLAGDVAIAVARRLSSVSLDPLLALSRVAADLLPTAQGLAIGGAIGDWRRRGRDCTPDDVPVPAPGGGRVLIQVGGLGTSSGGASIGRLDPRGAGYDPRDVVAFSYAGGCTAVPFGFDGAPPGSLARELTVTEYSAAHTHQDLELSARRLADLVDEVRRARPDAPIDLAAHSLGGVVARRALEVLAERHGGQVPVSVVVTMGSPHQGTELASAAAILPLNPWLGSVLDVHAPQRAAEAAAPSVGQLARGTSSQLPAPAPPPPGTRVVSLAAPGDLVVPAERSRWDGAVNTVAGPVAGVGRDVHGQLPGRPEARRELLLALAGLPARCIAFATAVGSAVTSRAIAALEGMGAAAVALLGLL